MEACSYLSSFTYLFPFNRTTSSCADGFNARHNRCVRYTHYLGRNSRPPRNIPRPSCYNRCGARSTIYSQGGMLRWARNRTYVRFLSKTTVHDERCRQCAASATILAGWHALAYDQSVRVAVDRQPLCESVAVVKTGITIEE